MMSSTVGLVHFSSTSKLELQSQSRTRQISSGNLSNRLNNSSNYSRPSLPDLLASEGLDPKPEYTTGYVQKIREQYLQLIAANNTDASHNAHHHTNLHPPKSHAPPPQGLFLQPKQQNSVIFSSRIREVSHQFHDVQVIEKSQPPKLVQSISADDSVCNGFSSRLTNDESETRPQQLVSSLRARFDQKCSPCETSQSLVSPVAPTRLSPKIQSAPAETNRTIPKTPQSEEFSPSPVAPPRRNFCHQKPMQDEQKAVKKPPTITLRTSTETVVANNKAPAPKPPAATIAPVLPKKKEEKEQVFGERVVIFKSRAFQSNQVHTPPMLQQKATTEKEQTTPDLILSSSAINQQNKSDEVQNMDWVDFGNGEGEFPLPESDEEESEDTGTSKCVVSEEFKFRIIGAAATIEVKPMWLRRQGESSGSVTKQLRFDDRVAVFGYGGSEDENEADMTKFVNKEKSALQRLGAELESQTLQLGLRPITAHTGGIDSSTSNGPLTANCAISQQPPSIFASPCARDALDMVF